MRAAAEPNIGNGYDYEKYSFVQTLKDATASFQMPKGTKGRDCDVKLTATSLRVGLKGQEPLVDGPLHETIKVPLVVSRGRDAVHSPVPQRASCAC